MDSQVKRPRRIGWFPIVIGLLVVLFLVAVIERRRIRAVWWAHQLVEKEDLASRGYYLALLAGDPVTSEIGWTSLLRRRESEFQQLAVYLLARTETAESTRILGKLLADPDAAVRDAAATALGFRAELPGAFAELQKRLKDGDVTAATAAAAAMGRVSLTRSRPDLVAALGSHREPLVRAQAAESLGSLLNSADAGLQSPCDVEVIRALCAALSDVGRFQGSLAIEREIEGAAVFAASTGRVIGESSPAVKDRTVSDTALQQLRFLTRLDLAVSDAASPFELDPLVDRCCKAYAARMAGASDPRSVTSAPDQP